MRFVEQFGVGIVGGCCGTTPEHIGQLAEAVAGRAPAARDVHEQSPRLREPVRRSVEFEQDNSFLIVAERTNANGSRKFKRLLDEEDWDGLVSMARDEVRSGSHVLDVCVDYVGRDGVADMGEVDQPLRPAGERAAHDRLDRGTGARGGAAAGGRQVHRQLDQPRERRDAVR